MKKFVEKITADFKYRDLPPPNNLWQKKRELADQLRLLSEQLLTKHVDENTLADIGVLFDQATQTLQNKESFAGTSARQLSEPESVVGNINREVNPVVGRSNPVAPPLNYWIEGNRVYGSVNCGWQYEGPPGLIHGGIIAALFDEFLGGSQVLSGRMGLTASLQVKYHKPSPLNKPLSMEGWVTEASGKRIIMQGELKDGEQVTATCSCLFIIPRESILRSKEN